MQDDIREYCNHCDNCQRTKAPRCANHGPLHHLESPRKLWAHILTDFFTDAPESAEATNILVLDNRFTTMAHCIPIDGKDSPSAAKVYLNNVWKYHRFPEDVISDRDGTFTRHYFTDLYNC